MLETLSQGWTALLEWWETLSSDAQAGIRNVGVVLAALLFGYVLARIVTGKLWAAHFDSALLPWSSAGRFRDEPGTPSRLGGYLVWLTVVGAAVWSLALEQAGLRLLLERLGSALWTLALVAAGSLWLGRVLTHGLLRGVQRLPLKEWLGHWAVESEGRDDPTPVALAVAALIYGLLGLLALMITSDVLGWSTTGSALAGVWQFLLRLLTAGVVLWVGWLGARWVRAQQPPQTTEPTPGETNPFAGQPGYYSSLAIVIAATLLAILLLVNHPPAVFGLVALLLLVGLVIWPLWRYIPDLWAGLLLRLEKIQQVPLDGERLEVEKIGLVLTHLLRNQERLTRRNRRVLEAHLEDKPKGN